MAWAQNANSRGVSLQAAQAHVRLEPLAVGVDQRDQRDRRFADLGGHAHKRIEQRLARRVQDEEFVQAGQAGRFAGSAD